uniref:C-type lectin domain-containing protein n=1 Tax=Periophthalmus magnuspinnatus TaxID=409849 RepID=A0A3B3ZIE7_9GOBI
EGSFLSMVLFFTSIITSSLLFVVVENGVESYFLDTSLRTWREAQSFCRGTFTDLVSVKTQDQLQDLIDFLQGSGAWIGLFRDEWIWSDQTKGMFRIWEPWNPDNYAGVSQDCGTLRLKYVGWDTLECDSSCHFNFLCRFYFSSEL